MKLDLTSDQIRTSMIVEASAGTGKTYAVAALVARELAIRDDLRIGHILITTFTRNAAMELRHRIRKRLLSTASALRSSSVDGADAVTSFLSDTDEINRSKRAFRLERALVEFDTATISTIHGVCSRVLRTAGVDIETVVDAEETDRVVNEVVNDAIVAAAASGQRWDESTLQSLLTILLGDPFIEAWFDEQEIADPVVIDHLHNLKEILAQCVHRVHNAMAATPDSNDLLRRAYELVGDPQSAVVKRLQKRFLLAIVDEAQDTDRLQWEFFTRLFPGNDDRSLVSVGDPKQAIYSFRGADVQAYVNFTRKAKNHRTLSTNWRSDQPLLDNLNKAFSHVSFGDGISYSDVTASDNHWESCLVGEVQPLEMIHLGNTDNQQSLVGPTVGKVIHLLEKVQLIPRGETGARRLEPNDICILTRTGSVSRMIERRLAQVGIPAVSGGTSSVMTGRMAFDLRLIFEAIEKPASTGHVRRAAATCFFGYDLSESGLLADAVMYQVQEELMKLSAVLTRQGLAAFGVAIEQEVPMMQRIAAGPDGERNLTDFLHIFEAMDALGPSGGCSPHQAVETFIHLANKDPRHDLVSRRIESDADAVRVLTMHAAKGLQFPCVIVADLWKPAAKNMHAKSRPTVFYAEDGERKVDIGFAVEKASTTARRRHEEAEDQESRRLLYVAATRAEHYLGVLVADGKVPSIIEQSFSFPDTALYAGERLDQLKRTLRIDTSRDGMETAELPQVIRSSRRMSFSSIVATRGREDFYRPERGGYDEHGPTGIRQSSLSTSGTTAGQQVIDLPAGLAVGRTVHEVFEEVDATVAPLQEEIQHVIKEKTSNGMLRHYRESLNTMVYETLTTPLGGPFGDCRLTDIQPSQSMPELGFEMGLGGQLKNIRVTSIGKILQQFLSPEDPLARYAGLLCSPAFDIPVGGLLTGSVDAVLGLPGSQPDNPRLAICDYKSNRLHSLGVSDPLQAYAPERLIDAMVGHHYPLQALLYGTALFRMLRWRVPQVDPDQCIVGIIYAFTRGMKGSQTPIDDQGRRYGVFTWCAPDGLWQALSDLLAGKNEADT
ncbi:MAG: UvrD-helicase domain-containing protein [Pirellulales bacterium]